MNYDSDLFVKHLQDLVRIPTVSNPDPDKVDWEKFEELHSCIQKSWPLLHSTFAREKIGRAGLLYTWKCEGKPTREPLMLIAHQDVVPEGNHSLWKHPPFGAEIHDGCIWGRGTTDSKCNIQAYMDALELLIAGGFKPACDIYLGFGYNEEIMGGEAPAAQLIAEELQRRGVSLGMLIDECGGLEEKDGKLVASIYVCEKGYVDFELRVDAEGGHSATPPKHSALGTVAHAAWLIENNPMPFRLTEPVIEQMKTLAPLTSGELGELYKDPVSNFDRLAELCEENRPLNGLMRTTTAVTMAKGSAQANILPETASILMNSRMLPGDTIEKLRAHLENVVPDGVKVCLVKGGNPPAVSSVGSDGYRLIESIVAEMYPDAVLVPSMLLGGTDSRYYSALSPTRSVYRFTGLKHDSRWGGAHKTNERIACDVLAPNVEFFVKLISRYCAK